ncbi:hypothetical protein B0H13DRAFT_567859 [Mycena leptocephala]|nr:hypothetical protein B0H13DRAFT_567859 [Mycena leptocephala]
MKIHAHPIVLALVLSFASLVAAQTFDGLPPAGSPAFVTPTVSITATAGPPNSTSYPASSYAVESSSISKGTVVAAAVGGSIAASLVVLAGVFFCLRYRAPGHKMMVIGVEGANNADIGRRCDQLEGDVRGLREQLDRLEAQRLGGVYGYGGGAVLYTHEKDVEAFKADTKGAKEGPPTYVD